MQRRRTGRRATKKEQIICQRLIIEAKENSKKTMTTAQLRNLKVECVEKIHALQVRRKTNEKTIQRRTNNAMFEADEKGFYGKMESAKMTGQAPTIDAAYQLSNGI